MNVLVVEDDSVTGECLKDLLDRKGYRACHVLNGEAAITALGSTPYDALVIDVYMPGIDGIDLLRKIRTLLPSRNLPVVVVTAGTERLFEEPIRELPPAVLVSKPYKVDQIVDALQMLGGMTCKPESSSPQSSSS